MWISTDKGWVNSDFVASVEARYFLKGEKERFFLFGADGGALGMAYTFPANCLVIPASEGYMALRYWPDEDKPGEGFVDCHPIVGWQIRDFGAVPITPDCDIDESVNCSVMYPDGRVTSLGDCTWENSDKWLEHCKKIVAEDAARKEKKSA